MVGRNGNTLSVLAHGMRPTINAITSVMERELRDTVHTNPEFTGIASSTSLQTTLVNTVPSNASESNPSTVKVSSTLSIGSIVQGRETNSVVTDCSGSAECICTSVHTGKAITTESTRTLN